MKHNIIQTVLTFLLFSSSICYAQNKKVVICEIKEDIAPTTTRLLEKTLLAAQEAEADLVILDIDTYGGLLTDGDSMRKMILNSSIPVDVYINKNAASAGALISIACRNIYMGKGASIGSATVVTDDGSKAPDKYQSYMRSIMRSTAESHGKFTIVTQGDTVIKYRRNPDIAEAMVDHRIVIPGIVDSAQILAFSTEEAIANGYCEGEVSGISDILKANKLVNAKVIKIEKSTVDSIVGFLSSPGIRGALIMFIFWGIFFEIRTPGIGFPLAAAGICALLYFAPLYLDGLAANWEILLFFLGLILLALEVFVIPGFGVAGITGIVLTVTSLILSLIRNSNFDFSNTTGAEVQSALTVVFVSLVAFVGGLFIFGKGFANSPLSKKLVLLDTLKDARVGGNAMASTSSLIGISGVALTSLRPLGKIRIGEDVVNAKSSGEFISEGSEILVIGKELGYWVVEKSTLV